MSHERKVQILRMVPNKIKYKIRDLRKNLKTERHAPDIHKKQKYRWDQKKE